MMFNVIQSQYFNNRRRIEILSISFLALVLLTIVQDFFHSSLHGYHFYLSESLLFKAFWLPFLPLLLLQRMIVKRSSLSGYQLSIILLATVLLHSLLYPFLITLLSMVFFNHTYGFVRIFYETLSEDLYKLVLIYAAFLCYVRWTPVYEKSQPGEMETVLLPDTLTSITVSIGKKQMVIEVADILYIQASTPYVSIHLENAHYLYTETLKAMNDKLDKTQFVRIHKSTIVNRESIVSYQTRLNGDYDIHLRNGTTVRLSRNYVPQFREVVK